MRVVVEPIALYLGAVVVLAIGYTVFWWSRSRGGQAGAHGGYAGPGVHHPSYLRDHQNPQRWYVHAFLAYYTGTGGDPAYSMTPQENMNHLVDGWGLRDKQRFQDLVGRYEQGECTLAFDQIRVIKLMRHAAGAGVVSDEESWARAERAAQRLHEKYPDWDAVYSDFQTGRDMWWRERNGQPSPRGEFETYADRYLEAQRFVIQGRPLR